MIESVDVDEARSLYPGLEITRVPNAGHMIPWDDFDGFFAALGDFLSR